MKGIIIRLAVITLISVHLTIAYFYPLYLVFLIFYASSSLIKKLEIGEEDV